MAQKPTAPIISPYARWITEWQAHRIHWSHDIVPLYSEAIAMHRLIGHSQRDSLDSTVQLSILIRPVVVAAVNLRRSTTNDPREDRWEIDEFFVSGNLIRERRFFVGNFYNKVNISMKRCIFFLMLSWEKFSFFRIAMRNY